MGKNFSEIVDRLKVRLGASSESEVAQRLGMTRTALYNHKNRGSVPYEALSTLCDSTGLSLDWVLSGKGGAERLPDDLAGSDGAYVTIRCVQGEISAGGGTIPDETPDMQLAFRKDWIARKGDPKKMSIIKVRGDSMEPTLLSGDLVLVNHAEQHINSFGGIYAISLDHSIMVKRLAVDYAAKMIDIISDNKNYPVKPVAPDALVINGKVIWFGREIER